MIKMPRMASRDRHRVGAYKRGRGEKLRWSASKALFPPLHRLKEPKDPWLAAVQHEQNKEKWHEIQKQAQAKEQAARERQGQTEDQASVEEAADASSDGPPDDAA